MTEPNNTLEIETKKGDSRADLLADAVTTPSVAAGLSVQIYGGTGITGDTLDTMSLIKALRRDIKDLKSGDMSHAEHMLAAQAATLDAVFHNMLRRASQAEYVQPMEAYMRIAMKAQAQCRTTWEAVSEIKNPRNVSFVRQANYANGPQQVNNFDARTGKTGNPPNEQSVGDANELRENRGAQALESGDDPTLETMGEVHRTKIA